VSERWQRAIQEQRESDFNDEIRDGSAMVDEGVLNDDGTLTADCHVMVFQHGQRWEFEGPITFRRFSS